MENKENIVDVEVFQLATFNVHITLQLYWLIANWSQHIFLYDRKIESTDHEKLDGILSLSQDKAYQVDISKQLKVCLKLHQLVEE